MTGQGSIERGLGGSGGSTRISFEKIREDPPNPPNPRSIAFLPEIAILLLAALTRFWRLGYHSIWFDEAVSLKWAGSDPGYIWRVTFQLVEEKHPPVYYLALHYWQALLNLAGLGHNDAALRVLGSLLGVLTVAGLMLLARRLSGRNTARLAGLLLALAPVMVWYSQELRMFQPAATGLVWAGYFLIRGWQGGSTGARLGWWIGFVLPMSAALYSYLFSAFLLPAAGLTVLGLAVLVWRTDENGFPWRRFVEGALAVGAAGILFLPLARNAWLVNEAEGEPGRAFQDFFANSRHLLQVFTVWRVDWPPLALAATLLLFAGLMAVGLLLPWCDKETGDPETGFLAKTRFLLPQSADRLFLWLWIGVPLLIANLLLAKSDSVFGEDRYLLFLAPFVLWAAARGAVWIGQRWRPAGVALAAAAAILLLLALPRLWTPAMQRENWRAAADYVMAYQERSPDLPAAWVPHVDYTHLPVEWYVRQRMDEDELPIYFPFGGALTPEMVDKIVAPPLLGIVETGADTLWLTQSHLDGVDDQRVVEGWLNANFPLITEQYPAGIKLSGYALRSHFDELPALAEGASYPDVELAPGLTLAACEITTPAVSAEDDAMHPPSGWVHVRLWWRADGQIDDDYIATVQMVGPEGVWGDRLYRENEALHRSPTSAWRAGEIVRDEIDVNLNPVTPPGEYPIVVGVMDAAGAPIEGTVECGRVVVER